VTDPKFGPKAWAESGVVSWGVFGVFAGAVYGLWVGRATTARRLNGIGPILAPGSSMLLAWADGPVKRETIEMLAAANAKWLVLLFNPLRAGRFSKPPSPRCPPI
jgi:hypothetical protein